MYGIFSGISKVVYLMLLLHKLVAYLLCSCYTHMNNFEVLVALCRHKSIFHAGHLFLAV